MPWLCGAPGCRWHSDLEHNCRGWTMANIGSSVGKGGINSRMDVRVIQGTLNRFAPRNGGPRKRLDTDGICGKNTKVAIRGFQRGNLGFHNPDGLVEVGGKTHQSLAAARGGTLDLSVSSSGGTSKPKEQIYDAIKLFETSATGQGTISLIGEPAYINRYRLLSAQVIPKLYDLWRRDEIGFANLPGHIVGNSLPGRAGPDILVNRMHMNDLAQVSLNIVQRGRPLIAKPPCAGRGGSEPDVAGSVLP